MKGIVLLVGLVAGVALVCAPAEAASKKKRASAPEQRVVAPGADPYVVRAYDGYILGRDPDPFIRLQLLRQGRPQDASGV